MPLLPLLLALSTADPALPVRTLQPSAYVINPGQRLALSVAADGAQQPWSAQHIDWMFLRIAAAQRNMDEPPVARDGTAAITFEQAGAAVVGIDFTASTSEPELADLRAFVTTFGSSTVALPENAGRIRLRRVESVKTIIRSGQPQEAAGASEATSKTGQQAEIRPLMDPTATGAGSEIPVRAYIRGAAVASARLFATHEPSAITNEIRCDELGIGKLSIPAPGPWRIELHELRPGDAAGSYTLYSATLTFEAPPAPQPKDAQR
jgi:hypothetical protein